MNRENFSLKKTGLALLVILSVIFISIIAFMPLPEIHNPDMGIDINWGGAHVCPSKNNTILKSPLPYTKTRPNESELFNLRNSDNDTSFTINHNNKIHYFVEVRRTILELEAGNNLHIPTYGSHEVLAERDQATGLPIANRGCYLNSEFPQFAHDMARIDVLNWYAKRGVFAKNAKFSKK